MRRGKVTIHKKWDQNIGILSGDLLMIFAFKMLEDIEDIHLSDPNPCV